MPSNTSHRFGRHGVALSGDVFRTEGYIQVAPLERGPVDIASRSKHRALEAVWDYQLDPNSRLFVVASDFSEERGNGTPLQTNDTQIKSLGAGASFITGKNQWLVQSFAMSETFDALFSSVSLDRTSELLTRSQRVPAQGLGGQALWRRPSERSTCSSPAATIPRSKERVMSSPTPPVFRPEPAGSMDGRTG